MSLRLTRFPTGVPLVSPGTASSVTRSLDFLAWTLAERRSGRRFASVDEAASGFGIFPVPPAPFTAGQAARPVR